MKQPLLTKDFVMSRIGFATCIGFGVHIPYLIRSLADSLALVGPEDLPLPIADHMWTWLAAWPYPHDLVHEYDWWTTKSARRIENNFLQPSTVDLCLERYRQDCADGLDSASRDSPITPVQELPLPTPDLQRQRCIYCRVSKVMHSDAMGKISQTQVTAATEAVVMETVGELGRRKMARVYSLAEEIHMKEMASPNPPAEGPISQQSGAQQSQWAPGIELTHADIVKRMGRKVHERRGFAKGKHHSGYFVPLPEGKWRSDAECTTEASIVTDRDGYFRRTGTQVAVPSATSAVLPAPFATDKYRFTPAPDGEEGEPSRHAELESLFGNATIIPRDMPPTRRSEGPRSTDVPAITLPKATATSTRSHHDINELADNEDDDVDMDGPGPELMQLYQPADSDESDDDVNLDGPQAEAMFGIFITPRQEQTPGVGTVAAPVNAPADDVTQPINRSADPWSTDDINFANLNLSDDLFAISEGSDDDVV